MICGHAGRVDTRRLVVREGQPLPVFSPSARKRNPSIKQLGERVRHHVAMAFAVVMTQIDDLSERRRGQIKREIVAIAYLMERELVVPHAVVLVERVLEDGFDPLALVFPELSNQVQ